MNCTHHINYGFKTCWQKADIKRKPPVEKKNLSVEMLAMLEFIADADWPQKQTNKQHKNEKENYECIVNCLPFMCGHLVSVSFFRFHVHHIETNFHAYIHTHTHVYRLLSNMPRVSVCGYLFIYLYLFRSVCCCYWYVKNVDLARIKL